MTPQYWPAPVVQLALVQLVLPQRFGVPAAPHASPSGQSPQSIWPPQPLPTIPQYFPPLGGTQTVGVQRPESIGAPQTLEVPPPPQVNPPAQSAHMSCLPHPSPMLPQYVPPGWAHFSAVQASPS